MILKQTKDIKKNSSQKLSAMLFPRSKNWSADFSLSSQLWVPVTAFSKLFMAFYVVVGVGVVVISVVIVVRVAAAAAAAAAAYDHWFRSETEWGLEYQQTKGIDSVNSVTRIPDSQQQRPESSTITPSGMQMIQIKLLSYDTANQNTQEVKINAI